MNIKHLKNKPIAALALVFFIMVPLLIAANFAHAATPTGSETPVIDSGPGAGLNAYTFDSSAVGTSFTIDVNIAGGANIWGWSFDSITWNPAVVQLTSGGRASPVVEGNYLKLDGDQTLFIVGTIDNTNGVVTGGIGDAISDGTQWTIDLSSGMLCQLQFKIVGQGDAQINFVNPVLRLGGDSTHYPATIMQPNIVVGQINPAPEYTWAALSALVAAFASFIVFAAAKKMIHIPTFSKHI